MSDQERHGFDVRAFVSQWGLDATRGGGGGGAHMWREVWDEDVSAIYKDILSKFSLHSTFWWGLVMLALLTHFLYFSNCTEMDEPRYGRLPKVDVYAELKQRKKYTM